MSFQEFLCFLREMLVQFLNQIISIIKETAEKDK